MLRDVYWRQYPIDLLNDDKMLYVESLMPEGFEFAPYMFYITALKLADDNGIFDIDDGIIFARLMRIKSRALVFQIANLMRQHKIVYRLSDDTTLMQLADWTYSDKKTRTAEERRRIVADVIQKERAKKANYSQEDFTVDGCAGKHNDVPQSEGQTGKCNAIPPALAVESTAPVAAPEAETAAPRRDFLLPEDDKKSKNVVINRMDDKSRENVENIQTDSTDNTIQEVHTTHTHTDTQQFSSSGQLESPTLENCQDTKTAVAEIQKTQTQGPTENQTDNDATSFGDVSTLAEQALKLGGNGVEENADSALFAYLNDFFVKNCYGYEPKKSDHAIKQLCEKIKEISDDVNPPEIVAGVLCSEFKKMCDGGRSEYWKGQALLPSFMLKTRCWMELMQHAGKILATNAACNKFTESWAKAEAEYKAEQGLISDAVRAEYVKYNINPEAPDANIQLLRAKSQEQEELRKAKEVEEEAAAAETEHGFEIF